MIWIVSILSSISTSPGLFSMHLGVVPRALTTIGVPVTFMFHGFCISLARSKYLSIFLLSFILTICVIHWNRKIRSMTSSFLLVNNKSGFLDRILWSVCIASPAHWPSCPGDQGLIPGRVIPKTWKMVLDTYLLNTQHYKVRIKGKVEKSGGRSSALPYTSM